jgi:hypothetical protein
MARGDDKQPWVQYDFGKKVKFSKVVVWSITNKATGKSPVINADVQVMKDGKWQTVGSVKNNAAPTFTISFPAVEAGKVRLLITKRQGTLTLSEVEVY